MTLGQRRKHAQPDARRKGGKLIDPTRFRGMVGSLMYLSASRPDIVFVVCMCARYQAKPTEMHLTAIKRIFRYLKETINMDVMTTREVLLVSAQFLGHRLVRRVMAQKSKRYWRLHPYEAEYIPYQDAMLKSVWKRSQLRDYGVCVKTKFRCIVRNQLLLALCLILWNAEERRLSVPPGYSNESIMPGLRTAPD
ncbi:hypothetical protein Tco_0466122 [Tanacetum coccineum]